MGKPICRRLNLSISIQENVEDMLKEFKEKIIADNIGIMKMTNESYILSLHKS